MRVRLSGWLCAVVLCPLTAAAQNQSLEIVQLAPGVHAAVYSEYRMDPIEGNSLIVIGGDGVLVVDSGRTPDAARRMIGEIRRLTDKPVRLVVNTHWHDDHIFGNQAYEEAFPGVRIVAHEHTRQDMRDRSIPSLKDYGLEYWTKMAEDQEARLAKGVTSDGKPLTDQQKTRLRDQARTVREFLPKVKALRVVLPDVTVGENATIYLGTTEVQLLHPGLGNTRGDIAVYLPKERVLATGDLLVHPVPFAYGSYPVEWIETLKELRKLPADAILPGHGPLMRDAGYLDVVIGLLESLVTQVRAAVDRGLSLEETRKGIDLQSFRAKLAGDDPVRNGMFSDSVLRVAVEQAYTTLKPTKGQAHGDGATK